jgi:hypothetical protein
MNGSSARGGDDCSEPTLMGSSVEGSVDGMGARRDIGTTGTTADTNWICLRANELKKNGQKELTEEPG